MGDRAMRESGFDPVNPLRTVLWRDASFCAGVPEQPAVSLRARYGALCAFAGECDGAAQLGQRAQARNAAIHRYLWRAKEGVFADYDFVHAQASNYAFITSLYPLWAGVASREEAKQDGGEAESV